MEEMIKMRIFFLLLLLGLISLSECQSSCGPGEECLEARSCQFYTVEREKLNTLRSGSADWTRQLKKLKDLVCNPQERKVCCQKTSTSTSNNSTNTNTNNKNNNNNLSPRDAPSYRPSLAREECGELNSHAGFILGGNDTRLGEYPFLALLGRTSRRNKASVFWHCGGTLVNKWYVLSAAHCGPQVDLVRLGEWEVVDPDSYSREACVYYNENSLSKCEKSCPATCREGDPTVDCDELLEKCSTSHQVSVRRCEEM